MSTLKAISTRLKSVKNIQKITKSMKMVSAAKFGRAERDLKDARPHGTGSQVFFEQAEASKSESNKTKENKLIIAITSDKGLCGAVHTQIAKAIKAELGSNPGQTKIVCVGDKSRIQLQMYRENIILNINEIGRLPPNFLDASKIAIEVNKQDFSVGKIFYNKFNSVVSYSVSKIYLFSESAVFDAPNVVKYDDLNSDVIESYLEFCLASLLYYALKENSCSEQASRMTAMDNASKNAGDMISLLTLRFNRTRQAVITRELIEIISGASALK